MATHNKRKLAALNKENCEERPRSNLAQNSNVPRSQEDYTMKVSEEIKGRVTKRMSKEFSRTENRILGALARLDDFLMNPLLQDHSGTTPEASRNVFSTSQGANEDDLQNDPHPGAGFFHSQTTQNSGPEDGQDSLSFSQEKHARKIQTTPYKNSGVLAPNRRSVANFSNFFSVKNKKRWLNKIFSLNLSIPKQMRLISLFDCFVLIYSYLFERVASCPVLCCLRNPAVNKTVLFWKVPFWA